MHAIETTGLTKDYGAGPDAVAEAAQWTAPRPLGARIEMPAMTPRGALRRNDSHSGGGRWSHAAVPRGSEPGRAVERRRP